jgi:monoamine oxidase
MRDYILKTQAEDVFLYNTRVTGIAKTANGDIELTGSNGYKETFTHVISTMPLPVLRTCNLDQADLTPMQSNALRQLDYGPSIKIGIQFQTAWWTKWKDSRGKPLNIVGGQSFTDSMLRTIVYPSFGVDVPNGSTTTLIASYCWTGDSERFGALIADLNSQEDKEKSQAAYEFLKDFVLRELAKIHDVSQKDLCDDFREMHAWSWSNHPYTMGKL